jgi:hypothetical protein
MAGRGAKRRKEDEDLDFPVRHSAKSYVCGKLSPGSKSLRGLENTSTEVRPIGLIGHHALYSGTSKIVRRIFGSMPVELKSISHHFLGWSSKREHAS